MIVNTHSHVYGEEFDADRREVLSRAQTLGVGPIIMPDIDSQTRERMFAVASEYPQCHATLGIHPTSVGENYEHELAMFNHELGQRAIVGIGEIGMDLYWDKTFLEQQEHVFSLQASIAVQRSLPMIIHVRKAFNETYKVLRALPAGKFSGVFHCFSGSKEEAYKVIDMGFHIGIGGVLTFKNSHLDEVVKAVPRQSLVLETDDPYLTPVPHRGERNEPGYVQLVAEKMAAVLGCSVGEVAAFTTENALRIFAI